MNIFQAYLQGFRTTTRSAKMITFIYLLIFVLALIVSIPFLSSLKSAAGNNMAPEKLLPGFNYTVIQELFQHKDFSFAAHLKQVVWVMFLFLFLSIFLSGGIISTLKDGAGSFRWGSFLGGSAHYFWRFVKLTFYMLLIHVLTAIIIYLPFAIIVGGEMNATATEKWIFQVFMIFFVIHIILGIFLIIVTDYARFRMVIEDTPKVLKSIWLSVRFVIRKFIFTYGLYLMLLILPVALFYITMVLSGVIMATSGWMLLLVFVLQQLFIWLRMGFRIWTFSSQLEYFKSHS